MIALEIDHRSCVEQRSSSARENPATGSHSTTHSPHGGERPTHWDHRPGIADKGSSSAPCKAAISDRGISRAITSSIGRCIRRSVPARGTFTQHRLLRARLLWHGGTHAHVRMFAGIHRRSRWLGRIDASWRSGGMMKVAGGCHGQRLYGVGRVRWKLVVPVTSCAPCAIALPTRFPFRGRSLALAPWTARSRGGPIARGLCDARHNVAMNGVITSSARGRGVLIPRSTELSTIHPHTGHNRIGGGFGARGRGAPRRGGGGQSGAVESMRAKSIKRGRTCGNFGQYRQTARGRTRQEVTGNS